jgi:hypothetical protein
MSINTKKTAKSPQKVKQETVTPISKTIPKSELSEFVGAVPNLSKIDSVNVYNGKFRINVWTREFKNEQIVPTNTIVKSFYVKYEEGVIYNETIS